MTRANVVPITSAKRRATTDNVIDFKEAQRRTLLRSLWDSHDMDGRAR